MYILTNILQVNDDRHFIFGWTIPLIYVNSCLMWQQNLEDKFYASSFSHGVL